MRNIAAIAGQGHHAGCGIDGAKSPNHQIAAAAAQRHTLTGGHAGESTDLARGNPIIVGVVQRAAGSELGSEKVDIVVGMGQHDIAHLRGETE